MKLIYSVFIFLFLFSCKENKKENLKKKSFFEFKVLDSKILSKENLWNSIDAQMGDFGKAEYEKLKPFILEQNIPSLQKHITSGKLNYELLTKFYLYRIRLFDRYNTFALNSIISINPKVIEQAKQKDIEFLNKKAKHPVFGMPILIKDNINTSGMPTTAGALVLSNNIADDAFIINALKTKGALILGKTNLSEWAYFLCDSCPSGYSAVGGQTLNPYGVKIFDTGGSSSGSAVATAANFCVAAIGSETAGSILSPASHNACVGLKPTIGALSRSGIVPISSTLDTPGPIAKYTIDTAIVFDAMLAVDSTDSKSFDMTINLHDVERAKKSSFEGLRFGVFKSFDTTNARYAKAAKFLKNHGAEIKYIEADSVSFSKYLTVLNGDMRIDLKKYLAHFSSENIDVTSVKDVVKFNSNDSLRAIPYGQALLRGILSDTTSLENLAKIKVEMKLMMRAFFDKHIQKHQLNGVLSINNYNAAHAAFAEYPAITVSMGYSEEGEPEGLTFISQPKSEENLLKWANTFEYLTKHRLAPKNYN